MNFVGHIATGVRARGGEAGGDVTFLLGTALPDFASMGRMRLGPADGPLGDGIALHHAADHAFHSEDWFVDIEHELRMALYTDGLPDGAARACAHVGPELLLDGALIEDPSTAAGVAAVWERIAAPDDEVVSLAMPTEAQWHWRVHLGNVATRLDPFTYRDAAVVAHRLHAITSRRPRLAFDEAMVGTVAARMASVQPDVEAAAPGVLDNVCDAVAARAAGVGSAMEVTTALLCDFVQVREGLLFVLSGGITRIRRPSFPASLGAGFAVVLELDRIEAEHQHKFELVIVGEDGEEVGRIDADIHVGEQVGAYAGENIQVPLGIEMHGAVVPKPGAYEIRVYVDGQHQRTIQFWAEENPVNV